MSFESGTIQKHAAKKMRAFMCIYIYVCVYAGVKQRSLKRIRSG